MSALDDLMARDSGAISAPLSALDTLMARDASGTSAAATANSPAPNSGGAEGSWQPPLSRTDRIIKGLRDPIDGGAQLLTKALPAGLVNAGNQLNNWLADKTGLVGRLPAGGVDQQVRQGEANYQASRVAAEPNTPPGFDGYRVLGNVLSPANLALGASAPAAASIMGRVGVGAATGAVSAALNPVGSGDFADEKIKQVGTGAAFGGALPVSRAHWAASSAQTPPPTPTCNYCGKRAYVLPSDKLWAAGLTAPKKSSPVCPSWET